MCNVYIIPENSTV